MGNAKHVLVADDDEKRCFFLAGVGLSKKPACLIRSSMSRDGQEAINYLSGKTFPERWTTPKLKLLLLDLKMPLVDGFRRAALVCGPVPSRFACLSSCFRRPLWMTIRPGPKNLGATDYPGLRPTGPEELVTLAKGLHDRWLKEE